ncbi:MAG: cell division protein FtsZ [Deltaproteobacteria bacterium]|nr:cell division protein FtsZ [Deltaproteobacteria bacterium]
MLEFDDSVNRAKIKVIGVGGGGGNAINTMIASRLEGVDFMAANTDCQALEANLASGKVTLGGSLTKGLGAGANPMIGRNAALEDIARLAEVLAGADMVFVTAGMGGGTGTGAAPIIAQVARECGALTVGVVTKPFAFEGKRRRKQAEEGIAALQEAVDTLITIPNQRLLSIAGNGTTMLDAFRRADEVLLNAVQGISDLITVPGLINVDFADVKTIMSNMGRALMGSGRARGENRAVEAAQQAISSPLLEDVSVDGATGILINITGGPDMTLLEVNEAAMLIQEAAHEDANIIFGSVIDANIVDELRITVIATGFDRAAQMTEREEPMVLSRKAGGQLYSKSAPTVGQIAHSVKMAAAHSMPAPIAIHTRAPEPAPAPAPEPVIAVAPPGGAPDPLPMREAAAGSGPNVVDDPEWDVVIDTPSSPYALEAAAAQQSTRDPLLRGRGNTVPPTDRDPTTRMPSMESRVAQPLDGAGRRSDTERSSPPPPAVNRSALQAALGLEDPEDEMDIPAFLRRPSSIHQ